jgi:hypothetical protein
MHWAWILEKRKEEENIRLKVGTGVVGAGTGCMRGSEIQ